MSDTPQVQIRDALDAIAPPWLNGPNSARFRYPFGLGTDLVAEKMIEGLAARLPGVGTPDALPILGADRLITRGEGESDATYASRLSGAFDAWQRAGSKRALLTQVRAYFAAWQNFFAGPGPAVASVSTAVGLAWATWDTLYSYTPLNATPAHVLPTGSWDWDSTSVGAPWNAKALWMRAWLVIYFSVSDPVEPEANWGPPSAQPGDFWGDANGSWGLSQPPAVWAGLRQIVALWKGAHSSYPWLIVAFAGADGRAGSEFSPYSPEGGGNPDGTWGRWSKIANGVQVASRSINARYCNGV